MPNHCLQGTIGAEFRRDLKTDQIAAIFRKGMNVEINNYSGFCDNRHLKNTDLTGHQKE